MNAYMSVFVICVETIIICYYSVLLVLKKIYQEHSSFKIYRSVAFTKMFQFGQMSKTLSIMTWKKWLILINHTTRVEPVYYQATPTKQRQAITCSRRATQTYKNSFFALKNSQRGNFFPYWPKSIHVKHNCLWRSNY